jgi:hypothetical protein
VSKAIWNCQTAPYFYKFVKSYTTVWMNDLIMKWTNFSSILHDYLPKPILEHVSVTCKVHALQFYTCQLLWWFTDWFYVYWQAALLALTENLASDVVTGEHVNTALMLVKPSLTPAVLMKYKHHSKQNKLIVLWTYTRLAVTSDFFSVFEKWWCNGYFVR